jgi:HAD superfamily hydrolase (TIGR01509 family)
MISTVLFDLDDLLSDTESLHCRAYQTALRQHGIALTDEQYHDHWVRRGLGISDFLRGLDQTLDPVSLRKAKAVEYALLVESCCQPMPGALDVLERLRGRKKLGLASSAYADAVDAVLRKLDIARYFECIVTGNQVKRIKPFPDIFLEAARRLGVAPGQCVVIEDAEKGVIAARAAGMKCIAVPSPRTACNDFSAADIVLPSLNEVTLELIERL